MNAEEAKITELGLELCQRGRRQKTVVDGIDTGVIVLGHNEANVVHGDEHLAAALLHRDALDGHLAVRNGLRALHDLLDCTIQAGFLYRLHQIVDGIHIKRLNRMIAVRGHKHDRRRILKLMQRLGKLQTRSARHRNIEEHDINATLHKHLDGGANARRFCDRADLARLLEQEAKFRTGRGLIIHNHRTQHGDKTFRQQTTSGIRQPALSP